MVGIKKTGIQVKVVGEGGVGVVDVVTIEDMETILEVNIETIRIGTIKVTNENFGLVNMLVSE